MRSDQPWLELSSYRLHDRCLPEPASALLCKNGCMRSLFHPPLLSAQPLFGALRAGVLSCLIIMAITHATWQASLFAEEKPVVAFHRTPFSGSVQERSCTQTCRHRRRGEGIRVLQRQVQAEGLRGEWRSGVLSEVFFFSIPCYRLRVAAASRVVNFSVVRSPVACFLPPGYTESIMASNTFRCLQAFSAWRTVILIFPLKSYLISNYYYY